jgi:23S rRNA (uracil1939-C5)-methyltransferase
VTPQRELGFMRDKSHTVVPIRECAAFVPELNDFIAQGNAIIRASGFEGVHEVHAVSGTSVAATFVSGTGERRRMLFGDPPTLDANGIRYRLQADIFFQANRFLLPAFASDVVEKADPSQYVLDLYCGSGFFSLPLARIATQTFGIESNRAAVALGRENARLNQLSNLQFLEGEAGTLLGKINMRPEVVVLNPPRAGAGAKNVEKIADLEPERVVYVSCNPATFAREAALLEMKGFKPSHIELAGLFSPGLG